MKMKGSKMNFDIEYIEKLSKVLNDNGLTEISLEDGDNAVTIRKDVIVAPGVSPVTVSSSTPEENTSHTNGDKPKNGTPIVSPMVGTFYTSPSPEAEPFVSVGQTVSKGDKVCIIEAMKLMNEIESEVSGKIVEICVKDGQPVEFGQVLMYVE